MKVGFYRVELHVSSFRTSYRFYDALFRWAGLKKIDRGSDYRGWEGAVPYSGNVWISQAERPYRTPNFHRKCPGRFHRELADETPGSRAVWEAEGFSRIPRGYYAVYFEDPDRIKLEVAQIPLRPRKRRGAGVI